ncbi:hypothetical protein [Microcoleus vaginatus]|uniref:hypothetical protein n=1 Tax=Microcoleus vaginatus TaxID=119532 RepID=UPI001F61A8E3
MKFNHISRSIAFLLATPLVTSLSVGIAPSSAATIAGSAAAVTIDKFSHTPADTGTVTNTYAQTIANTDSVISQAKADAVFISNCHELLAANLSQSEVIGSGNNYSGLAQSQAAVIGDFSIKAKETFSFTVQTILHLLTSVSNPQSERASAGVAELRYDKCGQGMFGLPDLPRLRAIEIIGWIGNRNIPKLKIMNY